MSPQLPRRSKSLRTLKADPEPTDSLPLLPEASPSVLSPQSQTASTYRYQLWPSKTTANVLPRTTFASDKLSALSVGRSSSSLSDTVVSQETVPFWQRSGSLARRRKVSVPELGTTMTTVQEMPIDSRKHDPGICPWQCSDTKQPPSLDDRLYARHQPRFSAMRDPAAPQAPTGEPDLSAMP